MDKIYGVKVISDGKRGFIYADKREELIIEKIKYYREFLTNNVEVKGFGCDEETAKKIVNKYVKKPDHIRYYRYPQNMVERIIFWYNTKHNVEFYNGQSLCVVIKLQDGNIIKEYYQRCYT